LKSRYEKDCFSLLHEIFADQGSEEGDTVCLSNLEEPQRKVVWFWGRQRNLFAVTLANQLNDRPFCCFGAWHRHCSLEKQMNAVFPSRIFQVLFNGSLKNFPAEQKTYCSGFFSQQKTDRILAWILFP